MKKTGSGIGLWVVGLLVVGIIALGLLLFWPKSPAITASATTESAKAPMPALAEMPALLQAARAADATKPGPLPASLGALPMSLQDTAIPDGWDKLDAQGNLLPTLELRNLFEYFLSALGEESLADITSRIQSALAALAEPAQGQAMEKLAQYLDYKLAVAELEANQTGAGGPGKMDLDAVAEQFRQARNLRRDKLSEDWAEAFFAEEENLDDVTLSRFRILRDDTLNEAQKAQQLAAAEQQLSPEQRAVRAESQRFEQYQLQAANASPAALQQLRETTFGVEAAARLAQLDQEEAQWQTQMTAYEKAKAQLQSAGLAPDDYLTALKRLRSQHFTEQQQLRVEALDAVQ